LFIDEIEKILSFTAAHRPNEGAVLALRKLMEAMSETRAMLVLVGLPEFEQFLPDDARQRIASFIRPSALTTEEIEMYIREANEHASGTDTIDPFTLDTIQYLAEIASGNARKVVRLCYHAWIAANAAESQVTPAMLRDITREHFESTTTTDVIAEIARSIEAHGWLFEQETILAPDESEERVDFWLPVGEAGSGIAILITSSVLRESEMQGLVERMTMATAQAPEGVGRKAVLIVNGYVADNLRANLRDSVDRLIIYRVRGFREDLDAVLLGLRKQLEDLVRENDLATVRQRVDEIARQNRSMDRSLSELLRRGFGRGELQAAVSTGLRAVFGQFASGTVSEEGNYPRIANLFDQALRAIDNVIGIDRTIDLIFGFPQWAAHGQGLEYLSYSRRSTQSRLFIVDALAERRTTPYSTALTVRAACLSFRRGINVVLNEYGLEAEDFPMDVVTEMCESFEYYARQIDFVVLLQELNDFNRYLLDHLQLTKSRQAELFTSIDTPSESAAMKTTRTIHQLPRDVHRAVREEIRG
jgi:hypothetical protein